MKKREGEGRKEKLFFLTFFSQRMSLMTISINIGPIVFCGPMSAHSIAKFSSPFSLSLSLSLFLPARLSFYSSICSRLFLPHISPPLPHLCQQHCAHLLI